LSLPEFVFRLGTARLFSRQRIATAFHGLPVGQVGDILIFRAGVHPPDAATPPTSNTDNICCF